MYTLKLYDKPLLTFKMENKDGFIEIDDIQLKENDRQLFPEKLQQEINSRLLLQFLRERVIPKNRMFVQEILEAQNLSRNDTKGIIDVCKGLSLNDAYWIVEDDSLLFDDFNLYENDFSETLSLIAFTGYATKIKGISTSPEMTTNGALPKAWRRINGDVYLFKGSTEFWHASNTGNEPYSEFYACQVANALNVHHVPYDLVRWKGMLASTCPLFTNKDISFITMYDASKATDLFQAYEWCKAKGFDKDFEDMVLLDAITLNRDRHLGNFGILKDSHTGELLRFAPLFDHGESLCAKAPLNAFENKQAFDRYLQNSDARISYWEVPHEEHVRDFLNKNHIQKVAKLYQFHFTRHPHYNLPEERLLLLEGMIQERARTIVHILENQ